MLLRLAVVVSVFCCVCVLNDLLLFCILTSEVSMIMLFWDVGVFVLLLSLWGVPIVWSDAVGWNLVLFWCVVEIAISVTDCWWRDRMLCDKVLRDEVFF